MAKKHNADSRPKFSTLGIDDEPDLQEELTAAEPVEFEPAEEPFEDEYYDDAEEEAVMDERYAKAERVLTVATCSLSVLLLLGSIAFWWYFVSRLSVCPIAVLNWKLYPTMLICCAAVTLAYSISEIMRRLPVSVENWMVSLCISGAISTVIMILFNVFTLGNAFSWMDAVTILCFSVSACALPAAVYTALRALFGLLCQQIEREKAADPATLRADVRAQCESRF